MENTNNIPNEIKIGDVEYVRKDSIKTAEAEQTDGMTYCIFRGHECGVHAGYLQKDNMFGSPNAFKVAKARRLWRWNSKFTLTELANSGVTKIDECKFSEPSSLPIILLDVYEVLPCTVEAAKSIMEVPPYEPNN